MGERVRFAVLGAISDFVIKCVTTAGRSGVDGVRFVQFSKYMQFQRTMEWQ